MKKFFKTAGLAIIVILAFIIVFSSKGNDSLDIDKTREQNIQILEDKYVYSIAKSDLNGQYKNQKGNNVYAMLGKNNDGTYRLYFIKTMGSISRSVILRIDDLELKADGSGSFKNDTNNTLTIVTGSKRFTISKLPQTTGDQLLEGEYEMMHTISKFSSDEFTSK